MRYICIQDEGIQHQYTIIYIYRDDGYGMRWNIFNKKVGYHSVVSHNVVQNAFCVTTEWYPTFPHTILKDRGVWVFETKSENCRLWKISYLLRFGNSSFWQLAHNDLVVGIIFFVALASYLTFILGRNIEQNEMIDDMYWSNTSRWTLSRSNKIIHLNEKINMFVCHNV